MTSTAATQQDTPGGITQVHAWVYECVKPGEHDKFYHIYLAELVGGEARVALNWGRNRTNGQDKTEHHKTVAAARARVAKVRAERVAHDYTLLNDGPIEPDDKVVGLLGLTGVSVAAATDPFERHAALAQRCLRLLTGDVGSEHLQAMRELRELTVELEEGIEEVRSRQAMLEARFRLVVMAG
jgi:predicted DNA-binding WGR domain protein